MINSIYSPTIGGFTALLVAIEEMGKAILGIKPA